MAEAAARAAATTRPHQRRIKNYLLDRKFQLKYAGYFVGIAALLSVALGLILWMTSQQLLAQSERVVQQGQEVVDEGKKVSDVVKMSIVKDDIYKEDAELLKAFEEGDEEYTKQLAAQQHELAIQSMALQGQHQTAALVLSIALTLFVLFVGAMGILVTHKVAGPIFTMKRQIAAVADGRLRIPNTLRKGDDLVDFFNAFHRMVVSLRERQQGEADAIEKCLARIEGKVDDADLEPLRTLLGQIKATLDA